MQRPLLGALVALLTAGALVLGLAPSSQPEIRSRDATGSPRIDAGAAWLPTDLLSLESDARQALADEAARQAELVRLAAEEAERLRVEQARIQAQVRPAPSAPQTATPRSGCGYEDLIRQTWPASQGDKAVAVAMRESGCTNTARNPSGASGLFQLMLPMHAQIFEAVGCSADQWADASCNVRAAFALWQGSGWGPWGG